MRTQQVLFEGRPLLGLWDGRTAWLLGGRPLAEFETGLQALVDGRWLQAEYRERFDGSYGAEIACEVARASGVTLRMVAIIVPSMQLRLVS